MAAHDSDASEERVTEGALMREFAHELRDALSPAASALDALRLQKFAPAAGQRTAADVQRALQRALATIDAFVLAEECERGPVALTRQPCNLCDVLAGARTMPPPALAARCEFAPCTEVMVSADVLRSIDVIAALLVHAGARAVPASRLEVCAIGEPQAEIRIRMRVDPPLDGGTGWFAGFRGGAAGMALRTARQLLRAQQGGLTVIPGDRGQCEFAASFRRVSAPETLAPAVRTHGARANGSRTGPAGSSTGPHGTRIIIVDDSAEVRKAYREPLVTLGYTVTEAVDAEQALRTLDGEPPNVALIDIHLPRMNGYRLAEALKARAGDSMRLIMLSGMTLDATTRRLSREAGFDDCLDKMAGPIALHLLLQGAAAR